MRGVAVLARSAAATQAGIPASTAPPTITGSPVQGQALLASQGTWTQNPVSYAYQWKRNTGSGFVNVAGATSNSYTVAAGDVGATLAVTVTATNAAGSTPVSSVATATVTASGAAGPVLTVAGTTITWPAIAGATDYKGAISTAARGVAGRTTSYVDPAGSTPTATSWTPPAAPGQTYYYGASVTVGGVESWSAAEVPIVWAAGGGGTKLRIGVNDIGGRNYYAGMVSNFLGAGITWDRVDVGTGNLTQVQANLALGIKSIVVYNPGNGSTPATYASQVHTLAQNMVSTGTGLTEIEFVNEPNLNGWYPADYAAAYAAAHAAIAGMGFTLIAYGTGDYQRANGTWSQGQSGGGWVKDVITALPAPGAPIIDAWSGHPYGPVQGVAPQDNGWAAVPHWRGYAVANGSSVPWYITEVGYDLRTMSEAQQATNLTQILNDLIGATSDPNTPYSYVVGLWYYETVNDSSGQWGLVDVNYPGANNAVTRLRPSFVALKNWMTTNAALVSG